MSYDFTLTASIPAPPLAIYRAWLDSTGHSRMTGGEAKMSAEVGGAYTAWDGYISGRNLALEPDRRIVQAWRTTQFTDTDPDSEIDVILEPVPDGTRITLRHSNVPDGHLGYRDGGWQNHYFDTMKAHFSRRA